MSGLALAGLGSIGPATAQQQDTVLVSAQSQSSHRVDTEVLRPWASGRAMMLLTARDVSEGAVSSQALRQYIATKLGAENAAVLDERSLANMAEALNTGIMAASKLDTPNGRPVVCLVSMGNAPSEQNPRALAAALAGLPVSFVGKIPGTAQQWHTAALLHEAAHCGQPVRRYSSFDVVTILDIETDADQRMLDAISNLEGYEGIARSFRDMRAIGALHYSDAGHQTAAGLYIDDEPRPAERYNAQDQFTEMMGVIKGLNREVGMASFDRTAVYQFALDELLSHTRQFTPEASRRGHPLLGRADQLRRELCQKGPADFVRDLGRDHPEFADRLVMQAGALIRTERGSEDTYRRFRNAAHRLLYSDAAGYDQHPVAARFLRVYIDAVDRNITSAAPIPRPKL